MNKAFQGHGRNTMEWEADEDGEGQAKRAGETRVRTAIYGMLIGALVGCVTTWASWDGESGIAAGTIAVSSAIGFAIGYFEQRRRSR